ncbi:hypothetical protein NLG97_g3846 [Lecanicillium saksenae]|uniref:Uncharacterized protein n=1 Tax=Lecanicillium saksenae TaxID=468837 RepID=A0ACC1R056_9HYPO|nr:hypothetical protein NLG97_g3846 [Lecanicillium saksenae]
MPVFGGNYRAHRSHGASTDTFVNMGSGDNSPLPASGNTISSDELVFNNCHSCEHQYNVLKGLKSDLDDAVHEKLDLRRTLESVTGHNKCLKRKCADLEKALRVAKVKNTTPENCQKCRGDEKEIDHFARLALKSSLRSKRATQELLDIRALMAELRDRNTTLQDELDAREDQFDGLCDQLTQQVDEQRSDGRDFAVKLSELEATKNDHIAALESELSRVKRAHEEELKLRTAQDNDRRRCIEWLTGRLRAEAPGDLDPQSPATKMVQIIKREVRYIAGKIRSVNDERCAIRALIERKEFIETEHRIISDQLVQMDPSYAN